MDGTDGEEGEVGGRAEAGAGLGDASDTGKDSEYDISSHFTP